MSRQVHPVHAASADSNSFNICNGHNSGCWIIPGDDFGWDRVMCEVFKAFNEVRVYHKKVTCKKCLQKLKRKAKR